MIVAQKGYEWLAQEAAPRHMVEAIKLMGITEAAGSADNPFIMGWAQELGLGAKYAHDSVAWCGLFTAIVMQRAGRGLEIPRDFLWALNWVKFGHLCGGGPSFGDVLVKPRVNAEGLTIGGHVFFYVGEDKTHYHGLGGNQDDSVSVRRFEKSTIISVRRPAYKQKPKQVRRILLSDKGAPTSKKET